MNSFEQATLEQLVSYKASTDADISRLMNSERLKSEVRAMVARWNINRVNSGLKPFK